MAQQDLDALFQFPCPFPIKIMGEKQGDLPALIKQAFKDEGIDISKTEWTERLSTGEKYLSITVIFTAESREQLDKLYQRLTKLPGVKMVL